jgi:hypothetical protein
MILFILIILKDLIYKPDDILKKLNDFAIQQSLFLLKN